MNLDVLHKEVQEFILDHLTSDISKLILKGSPFSKISIQEIAQQIIGKQKAKEKLPTWYDNSNILFPPKLNLEQTSSEKTAAYKSSLIQGKNLIDLTGGFGIDTFYFSQKFARVVHCELNEDLSSITQHNAYQLEAHNIEFHCGDGVRYLSSANLQFDCIYADPSRRSDKKGKVFLLEDCIPDIPKNLDALFNYSDTILLKYSPMLDIQKGIDSLHFVEEVHVVAIDNEVKELLFVLREGYQDGIEIKTINFTKKEKQEFSFLNNQDIEVSYSSPLSYLYEPNHAILKSGGFKEIAQHYNIAKLHQHSHLYTSDELLKFPGRTFIIEEIFDYNKKTIKMLSKLKANVTTRNFPHTVNEIRKKMKLSSGGDIYLFFTTNHEEKLIVLKAKKAQLD